MKAKIIAALTIVAAVVSLETPVHAQSLADPNVKRENHKITGDSLEGIGTRTAQDDFMKFFEGENINSIANNNQRNKLPSDGLHFNRSTLLPSTSVFFQPSLSTDGNDGLQLQLDLGS
ncbi:hypothetical protein IQ259_13280 [Fortiea sp. LEGE XX443]|uniref:hypothetical protein n=1 Tax=Fortiea sp. LEGE XX443 TaxID=1828611 RepID=UPI0018820FEA|nr:hypothetical protein [Fortiea sp. LEGE XX443]MBE9005995.1 hypothetical protein [Fortiea sp. LEGE XX443]